MHPNSTTSTINNKKQVQALDSIVRFVVNEMTPSYSTRNYFTCEFSITLQIHIILRKTHIRKIYQLSKPSLHMPLLLKVRLTRTHAKTMGSWTLMSPRKCFVKIQAFSITCTALKYFFSFNIFVIKLDL